MEKITKDISEIIADEIKTINNKVRGLNFLELLKVGILEKLFPTNGICVFRIKVRTGRVSTYNT